MKPGVYITFDVECSMGGAWRASALKPIPPSRGMMGIYGDKAYGIPLICNILERYDLKGTFFLEPFNDELGYPGETEPVCKFLKERGHDIQLHVHPGHAAYGRYLSGERFIKTDQMDDLPLEEQAALVKEGADRIERFSGTRPIAFRAGNMGASERTLTVLPEAGLWIDSSYTFPYLRKQCRFLERHAYNGAKWYGEVLEVALSGFTQTPIPGLLKPSQPLDIMGTSFRECRQAVRVICEQGAEAVVILHSFSLFKWRDLQYNGGRLNRLVKCRFERFCKWLSENRDLYPTRTFAELGNMVKEEGYRPKEVGPCRLSMPFTALLRKFIQALNGIYWV